METIIAVPLLRWFLVEAAQPVPLTAQRSAILGFIASLAILARLDSSIALGLAIVGFLELAQCINPVEYAVHRTEAQRRTALSGGWQVVKCHVVRQVLTQYETPECVMVPAAVWIFLAHNELRKATRSLFCWSVKAIWNR